MKILVNAVNSKTGSTQVLVNSFLENIDENGGNEYYFLIYRGSIRQEILENKPGNITVNESLINDKNRIKRFFWYQFVLPFLIRKNRFDGMINLAGYGPVIPLCAQILLLHDPNHVAVAARERRGLLGRLRLMLYNLLFFLTLLGTDRLVVHTRSMKSKVMERFGYRGELISVIPAHPGNVGKKAVTDLLALFKE